MVETPYRGIIWGLHRGSIKGLLGYIYIYIYTDYTYIHGVLTKWALEALAFLIPQMDRVLLDGDHCPETLAPTRTEGTGASEARSPAHNFRIGSQGCTKGPGAYRLKCMRGLLLCRALWLVS